MKRIFFAIPCIILFFLSCKKEEVILNVPWFVSLNDIENLEYNSQDTLKKYEGFEENDVVNKAQFLSFKAQLYSMVNDSAQSKKYIKEAFLLDSVNLCKNLLVPMHNYLVKDQPHRKIIMPSILNHQLDYIIDLFSECNLDIPEEFGVKNENRRLFYWICYFRIRDQWYRVPQRAEDWEAQTQIDIENQKLFDQVFIKSNYPSESYFQEYLQLFLLHSDNATWTYEWLKVYLDVYKKSNLTLPFIYHFKNRSYVADSSKIQDLIYDYETSRENE